MSEHGVMSEPFKTIADEIWAGFVGAAKAGVVSDDMPTTGQLHWKEIMLDPAKGSQHAREAGRLLGMAVASEHGDPRYMRMTKLLSLCETVIYVDDAQTMSMRVALERYGRTTLFADVMWRNEA